MTSALKYRRAAAVLAARFCIGRSVHVGQEGDFLDPQAVDDDMHMNIAAVVVSIRVGANQGLMVGKMRLAELLLQHLRPVCGQAVVRPVPWGKADDVLVTFHIVPPLICSIAEIGAHTGNGKVPAAAVQDGQAAALTGNQPAVFVQEWLVSKRVMLKQEILFGGSVVGIFRAQMLECCQPHHRLSLGLRT